MGTLLLLAPARDGLLVPLATPLAASLANPGGPATPEPVAVGARLQYAATVSVSPALPVVYQAGDLLLAHIVHDRAANVTGVPNGWALVPVQGGSTNPVDAAGSDARAWLYYKITPGPDEEALPTWTLSASTGGGGAIITAVRGVDPDEPFDPDALSASTASGTTHDPPAIAVGQDRSLVVLFAGTDSATSGILDQFTWPEGYQDVYTHEGGATVYFGAAAKAVDAGEEDPGAFTSVTSLAAMFVVALAPAG